VSQNWDKTKWKVNIDTTVEAESAQDAINMVRSMYMLEDPSDVEVGITITGNEAVDLLFGLEK